MLSLPAVQHYLARQAAETLTETLGAKVEIGSLSVGLLNRITIDDVVIYEQEKLSDTEQGEKTDKGKTTNPTESLQEGAKSKILSISRLSANLNLIKLLTGHVDIGTAQLFGTDIVVYKENPDSDLNCQFLLDFFKTEDEEPSDKHIHIGSFIMRNTRVKYDVHSEPFNEDVLDLNHISLKNFDINLALRVYTNDSLNLNVNRFKILEQNSNLNISDANFSIAANTETATIRDFELKLPNSILSNDSIELDYKNYLTEKTFSFSPTRFVASLSLKDFAPFYRGLSQSNDVVDCEISIQGQDNVIKADRIKLSTQDKSVDLICKAFIENAFNHENTKVLFDVDNLAVNTRESKDLMSLFFKNDSIYKYINNLENINFKGSLAYSESEGSNCTGNFFTGAGDADIKISCSKDNDLALQLLANDLNVGQIIENATYGKTSFFVEGTGHLDGKNSTGSLSGNITDFTYKSHDFVNTTFNVERSLSSIQGDVAMHDEECTLSSSFKYDTGLTNNLDLQLVIDKLRLSYLPLLDESKESQYNISGEDIVSLTMNTNVYGKDFEHLLGDISVKNARLVSGKELYSIDNLSLSGKMLNDKTLRYSVESDILNGSIQGNVPLAEIINCVKTQFSHHLSKVVKGSYTPSSQKGAFFDYAFSFSDAPIIHKFIDDYSVDKPFTAKGNYDHESNEMIMKLSIPQLNYQGTDYSDIQAECVCNPSVLDVNAIGMSHVSPKAVKDVETNTSFAIRAKAHNNTIDGDLFLDQVGKNKMKLSLKPVVHFSDSIGKLKTTIDIRRSYSMINDTAWTVTPSSITLFDNEVECRNVHISNESAGSTIHINGKASMNANDSLVVKLKDIPVNYVTSAINFHAVEFSGLASGTVHVNSLVGKNAPDFNAILNVKDFSLQGGSFGDAIINAKWDKDIKGVVLDARIVDLYNLTSVSSTSKRLVTGITTVDGYIAPSTRGLLLNINTMNTSAKFLEGFIGSVLDDINGTLTGPITLLQNSDQFNLLGDAVADLTFKLVPTNMVYGFEKETVHLTPGLISIDKAKVSDAYGNHADLDVKVTHSRMQNWGYDIAGYLDGLCAYDEKEFNSDKFLATFFARGNLRVKGDSGEPLTIDANVTPAKGSMFAYDASTPDAIIGNSFISFRDKDSLSVSIDSFSFGDAIDTENDSIKAQNNQNSDYRGDIRLNINVALTPDCEIKLKMDNLDDGYMSTRGFANLHASWYNKGLFQLYGDYNIESGSYRMYLHDLIFRDLLIQKGSKVEFNGNPFDADIHLVCNHTLNSVPLTDLTSTSSLTRNNKVKVVCRLDITGTIDNMDFKFDMDMPNVSDEVRQVVRSMVSTDEEMNKQALFLLGVGRFFPSEYARPAGTENNSGQAVNSLLSSTLSGQINQMLTNMLGRNSNWTLGSSLATGEKGWEDLDVEGILSGRMLDDRLLLNGNFGYRDNSMVNRSTFVGDFEVKWRMTRTGKLFIKAYNQTNDRYFTKATLNTQGIGLTWQQDFESIRKRIKEKQ